MNTLTRSGTQWVLTALVVLGLAVDAFVHFDLASAFEGNRTSVLSEAQIFRAQSIVAIIVALGVLVRPRRYTAALAFLVAAGALIAVVLYRYVDIGAIGPIPNMYDPYWGPIGKVLSLIGEALAAAAALLLFLSYRPRP